MPRKSIGEYPPNWPLIARQTKEEAGWCCIRCGHPHDTESGHTLTVHHLDLDKSNCRWWNICSLCQKCHLHIQAKVVMEWTWMLEHSGWFKPYYAGWIAHEELLQELSREEVEARLPELLQIGQPWLYPATT